MSTFTYTIKYPDGRIEHHTGTVRKDPPVSPRKDIEEAEAKIITNAARVGRRESQFEMAHLALDVNSVGGCSVTLWPRPIHRFHLRGVRGQAINEFRNEGGRRPNE